MLVVEVKTQNLYEKPAAWADCPVHCSQASRHKWLHHLNQLLVWKHVRGCMKFRTWRNWLWSVGKCILYSGDPEVSCEMLRSSVQVSRSNLLSLPQNKLLKIEDMFILDLPASFMSICMHPSNYLFPHSWRTKITDVYSVGKTQKEGRLVGGPGVHMGLRRAVAIHFVSVITLELWRQHWSFLPSLFDLIGHLISFLKAPFHDKFQKGMKIALILNNHHSFLLLVFSPAEF